MDKRKQWTIEEKKAVLEFFQSHGIAATIETWGVSSSMVYKWAEKILNRPSERFPKIFCIENDSLVIRIPIKSISREILRPYL